MEKELSLNQIKAESAANPNTRRAKACYNTLIEFIGELAFTGAIIVQNKELLELGFKCLPFQLRSSMDDLDRDIRNETALEIAKAARASEKAEVDVTAQELFDATNEIAFG